MIDPVRPRRGRVSQLLLRAALSTASLALLTTATAAQEGSLPDSAATPAAEADAGISAPLMLPPPPLPPAAVQAEAARLRAELMRDVHDTVRETVPADERWIALAKAMLAQSRTTLRRPQVLVVVDRNPRVEQLALVVAQPDAPWLVIGGTHVSTGQAGRFDHYITPTGVFVHDASILDYRAEGTYNQNHIRGLGTKGMRVWDFGWQWARKGWRGNGEQGQIRLLMHATDPVYLARRLGHPASDGCVRIPADMNRFMDHYSILDRDYLQAARFDDSYDSAIAAVLPADRDPTPLAGDKLVVVDSSEPGGGVPIAGGIGIEEQAKGG